MSFLLLLLYKFGKERLAWWRCGWYYDEKHLMPLHDTISNLTQYCKRQGGTIG